MTITIYHNPRCSKSRKTLEIIENSGVTPQVVRYLEEPPDGDRILELAATIGVPVSDLLRRNEDDYRHADRRGEFENPVAVGRFVEVPDDLRRDAVVFDYFERFPGLGTAWIVIDRDRHGAWLYLG